MQRVKRMGRGEGLGQRVLGPAQLVPTWSELQTLHTMWRKLGGKKVDTLCRARARLQHAHLNKQKIFAPVRCLIRWNLFRRMCLERERTTRLLPYSGEQKDCTTKIWDLGEHLSLRFLVCTQKNLSIALHNLCLFAKDTHTIKKWQKEKGLCFRYTSTQAAVEGLATFAEKAAFSFCTC